ncbi:MAG: hypothetical protein L3J74_07980 [Bacteroidales bacterium]|nr:hypothetical protein [Bacteroidales bacterium]
MNWFKNIFGLKHTNKDNKKKQFLLEKINSSINNCQTEIQKSEKEITQIKKWLAELIHENFFVPGDYWYEEIKYYDNIKNHKENSGISPDKINNINKLLEDYQTQIRFREKKIELKQLLLEKFQRAKQQLIKLESNHERNNLNAPELKTLEKHQSRIQKLNQLQNEISQEQEQDELLQQLMFQINELIENKQIDQEVKAFMKKLNAQFTADTHLGNPEKIIMEMERLIKEYKSKS